jgi:metal-sulfur cluster biosynthetic enzyme
MATREEIVETIKTILDPDILIDIYTLGLIYDMEVRDEQLKVTMTFTSPACPAGPQLIEEIVEKTEKLEGIKKTEVEVTFSPPWEPSDELKAMMGIY